MPGSVSCSWEQSEEGRRGWQGREQTVTHHQFMVGWRNAGGSHLWEEQRKARLASFIPTENQGLLRSFHSHHLHDRHPFPPLTHTDTLVFEFAGRLCGNTEKCLGNVPRGEGAAEGKSEMYLTSLKLCKEQADAKRLKVNAPEFS